MTTSIAENGVYLDVNDAVLVRLGYAREEMVGENPEAFMTKDSIERIEKELRPALRRTGKLENKPISFISKMGEVVDCLTSAFVEYDREGEFLRTVAMYSEVSDEARANFKYRTLYRATPAMLHTVDADGNIVTVTDRWLEKLGYTRDEVVGRPISDFFSLRDRKYYNEERLKSMIGDGEFTNLERQMLAKDGTVLHLVMSSIASRDENNRVDRMLVASKDVTERLPINGELVLFPPKDDTDK